MAIPNYIRPQLTIKQFLDRTPDRILSRINAVVVGARYLLSRYGREEVPTAPFEAESASQTIDLAYYDSEGQTVDLAGTNLVLDPKSVRVTAVDVEADLGSFEPVNSGDLSLNPAGDRLELGTGDNWVDPNNLPGFLDGRPVRVGDVVYIKTSGSPDPSRRTVRKFDQDGEVVVLDTPVVNNGYDVEEVQFTLVTTFDLEKDTQFTLSGTTVTVISSPEIGVAGKDNPAPILDIGADSYLAASFRAVVPATADEKYVTVRSEADIIANAGPIDLDNDLAYAASRALSGAQGRQIFMLAVSADTPDGFQAALRKIESTDFTYALVPVTEDEDVHNLFVTHVSAMSTDEKKNFRRTYIGVDSPGEYEVLSNASYEAAPYMGEANRLMTFGGGLIYAGVGPGFIVQVGNDRLEVGARLSDTELVLIAGEAAPTSSGVATIWAPDTAETQVEFLRRRARQHNNRRAAIVWAEKGTAFINNTLQVIPQRFVAAEIAGIRSALPPQAGLTRFEITTISNAPAMYTRYTQDQLDEIAAEGVFIITQDVESGVVFVRHQLTTKTDEGSLYYEDSVGTNVDDLSLGLKDILRKYIGRYNVTPQTIAMIDREVEEFFDRRTRTLPSNMYGPQIISYQDLIVRAHETFKDRVEVLVRVEVPLPLNNIDVYLRASVGLTI